MNFLQRLLGGTSERPKTRYKEEWYSEYAICPMDGAMTHATYHSPQAACGTPAAGTDHNHLRCRCGYQWTLPPKGA